MIQDPRVQFKINMDLCIQLKCNLYDIKVFMSVGRIMNPLTYN